MEKKEILEFLNGIFKPLNYKKKNNKWSLDNGILIKKIELQKSYFGNAYYLNYGINFKGLIDDTVKIHIFRRLGGSTDKEIKEINLLMDFEAHIPRIERESKLRAYIYDKTITYLNSMNTEEDVKIDLIESSLLNTVVGTVKEYLQLY